MLRALFPTNPLSLFQGDQLTKLAKLSGEDIGKGFSAYWHGEGALGADPRVARIRQRSIMAAGSLIGANALNINPFGLTDKVNNMVAFGAHMGLGYAAFKLGGAGKLLGLGYMAMAGANTFRPGDQIGPM